MSFCRLKANINAVTTNKYKGSKNEQRHKRKGLAMAEEFAAAQEGGIKSLLGKRGIFPNQDELFFLGLFNRRSDQRFDRFLFIRSADHRF